MVEPIEYSKSIKKTVEPNSGLGEAIDYMLKRKQPLTLFLRKPGAVLDNNICEQALKMAILGRKNSLGHKTVRGAQFECEELRSVICS